MLKTLAILATFALATAFLSGCSDDPNAAAVAKNASSTDMLGGVSNASDCKVVGLDSLGNHEWGCDVLESKDKDWTGKTERPMHMAYCYSEAPGADMSNASHMDNDFFCSDIKSSQGGKTFKAFRDLKRKTDRENLALGYSKKDLDE